MIVIPGQHHLSVHVVRLEGVGRAHQQHDPRVGDRMRDLFAVVLPAKDVVTVSPDRGPFLLQQASELEHLLGVLARVADEDLRLSRHPNFRRFSNHGASDPGATPGKRIVRL